VVKVFFGVRTIVPYILLGWLPVMLDPLALVTAPTETFWLVVAGGLAYTFGLVFLMLDRIHGFHAIWHLFVILGSILHFLAIYGVSK
jgi:hemolysin III